MQTVRQDVSHLRLVITSLAALFVEGLLAIGLIIALISLSPWLTM